ncbi:MAG: hypothetical protein QG597_2394 [Actinomycetota bacterium]|nr:hypothetical protein [Actinomycetota bacterium]
MNRLVAGGFVVILLIETLAFLIDPWLALPVTGIAVACLVVLASKRLVAPHNTADDPVDADAAESLRQWRSQTDAAIAWADGTRGDWDRHLRPRLAREFMLATGHKARDAQHDTGRMVFGDDLWPWVDASNIAWADRDAPGPGRAALEDILRRLEQA